MCLCENCAILKESGQYSTLAPGALLCNFRSLNVESCFRWFLEAHDSKYSTSCFCVGLHQLCKIHDVVPNQDQSKSVNIGN